jgi:hypothetical protein
MKLGRGGLRSEGEAKMRGDVNPEVIEIACIFTVLIGATWCVKAIFWGRGPVRRARDSEEVTALEERMAELEDRLSDLSDDHRRHTAELEERLDFTERMLTREAQHRLANTPEDRIPTPV